MPLIETLTVYTGGAVARSLLKLWLRDENLALDASLSIADLANAGAKGFLEKRRLERSFERIAEEVAEKLNPYLDSEFSQVSNSETQAAIIATQETIDQAKLDLPQLLALDLDPLRLESALRAGKPNATEEALLSDQAAAVYDFIIREASNYLVEVISTLPDFHSRATREMLERDSTLIALVEEVLTRLPDASPLGTQGDSERLEDQYRREVARKLDRLDLFGVRTSDLNQRFALSVAYIALTASKKKYASDGAALRDNTEHDEDGRTELSVEDLVSEGSRSLIRGEAGSGKTTLLQWLAVSSARQRFADELKPWNDTVPFLIKLRQYVGGALPLPKEFPASINPTFAESIPGDWVIELMKQGRGLVLVDGVDELREDERAKAFEWLTDLIHAYPDSKYVVTSRPPAVDEDWLKGEGFASAFLEPMDVQSIDSFIEHWHDAAVDSAVDPEEQEELKEFSRRLRSLVRETPQIRSLAASPLLCAMLCALTRDWKGQLPRDRVELYRVGLEMLLERRDRARSVQTDQVKLSRQQKEALLQDYAYWLLINGYSDAQRGDFENLLSEKVESLPQIEATAEEILEHLLMRSGLLREPVEGRIDFIHRTFLEYLAAKRAVDDRSIGLLAEHAYEDQWHGVIVLAAGLGTEAVSYDLIKALLAQGAKDATEGHRVQLLAVACLETTSVIPKELQDEIAEVLEELMPPANMTEAKQIASAGDIAAPMLAKHVRAPVALAAPCVRALGLIGSATAMAQLEKFGKDKRVTVARELIRCWDHFPTTEYARRVLSQSPLNRGAIEARTAEQLATVQFLSKLRNLACVGAPSRPQVDWPWHVLRKIEGLEQFSLRHVGDLAEFPRFGDNGKSLRMVAVNGCPALEIVPLEGCESLELLTISHSRDLVDLPGIGQLPQLRSVTFRGCPKLNLREGLPLSVKTVRLQRLGVYDLSMLVGSAPTSINLSICNELKDVSAVSNMETVRSVSLFACDELTDASAVFELPGLSRLTIDTCQKLDVSEVGAARSLKRLTLESQEITDLSILAPLDELEVLDLTGNDQLRDLGPLSRLAKVNELTLTACESLSDLSPLGKMNELKSLNLELCAEVVDLAPLLGLPQLEWLGLRGCSPELDPGPLEERGVKVVKGYPTTYGRYVITVRRDVRYLTRAANVPRAGFV